MPNHIKSYSILNDVMKQNDNEIKKPNVNWVLGHKPQLR